MNFSVRPTLLALFLVAATSALGVGEPKFGTFRVDVISLISDGKTEPGKPEFAADHQGYRYLFTSESHQEEFKKNPTKYEVQLGGACGKMAELSGRGSTDRYWIYKGKLYVFASDGCRTGFQSNPEGHIETDEPKLKTTPLEARKGRELLEKAAKWSGLDKIGKGGVAFQLEYKLQQRNQSFDVKTITIFRANGDYEDVTTYNNAGFTQKIEGERAFELDQKSTADELVPTWKRALERQRARQLPFLLLRRNDKGLTCKLDGIADGIASVVVNLDGATSTLWIEEATGKVLSQTIKGRNQLGIIGEVQREFTKYSTKSGVTLPVAWTGTYNGADSSTHNRAEMELHVFKK